VQSGARGLKRKNMEDRKRRRWGEKGKKTHLLTLNLGIPRDTPACKGEKTRGGRDGLVKKEEEGSVGRRVAGVGGRKRHASPPKKRVMVMKRRKVSG